MIDFLLTPLAWVFFGGLLTVVAAVARRRFRRPVHAWPVILPAALSWMFLVMAASPVTAELVTGPLSRWGLRWPPPPVWAGREEPDAIVVFSGGLAGVNGRTPPLAASSLERLHETLVAARRWPAAVVIFSGGSEPGPPWAAGPRMAEEAAALGLDRARIVVESRARDTRQNAINTAELLAQLGRRKVALVTSPEHMARARAALWRAGYESLPLPSAPPFRLPPQWTNALPDTAALVRTTNAIHEIVGLAVYRVRGWIGPPPAGGHQGAGTSGRVTEK